MDKCFKFVLVVSCLALVNGVTAQPLSKNKGFTRQDTLRGSLRPERNWWNVTRYDILVEPDIPNKTISGYNDITFDVVGKSTRLMQIDLQEPMEIVKVENLLYKNQKIDFKREGNVFWLNAPKSGRQGKIRIYYKGTPRAAVNPPWDGGWIWKKDSLGRPFVSVACQGLGASVWMPCKDHQSDEPDKGATLTIIAPGDLTGVGNGRLVEKKNVRPGYTAWTWKVVNPINNYDIIPYLAHYVNFTDTIQGEKGKLDASYWVLDYNLERAKKQFAIVRPMIKCFESWMGPYPFYEDSYKLVEAPHLGMEHQSAVAYGNGYQNGYRGKDLSGTGLGLYWDFIVVHESGHEWFGNSITAKDVADMWIHEGFTTYAEVMYIEDTKGVQAGSEYMIGREKRIQNDIPVIGHYGVNREGSADMYDKGAAMLHTIRQLLQDDKRFKEMLREISHKFYHKTVTTKQIEDFMTSYTGLHLQKVFDQYLRSKDVPVLEFKQEGNVYLYRWASCINGFDMKVRLANGTWLQPEREYQTLSAREKPEVDKNFFISVKYL
ncbi:MAG: M1 family metallopeptidase [Niabella sp.]